MIAALLTTHNAPLALTEVEPCDELQPGQVLVRVLVSGICGKQLGEIAGTHDERAPLPRLLGHEGCGIVEQVGPGVTKLKAGQKVIMHWRKSSGMDAAFPRYAYHGGTVGGGRITTFAEMAIVSENRLTVVPQETPNELCALLGCGLSTALGVMENEAQLKMGESVLIVGCGGVGLNLIRVAKMMGGFVCGLDRCAVWEQKVTHVLAAGGSALLTENFKSETTFDVIVDTTGDAGTIVRVLPLLAPSGRFIMVGQPTPETPIVITSARHLFDGEGKTLKATQGGGFMPDRDIPRYMNMWRSGHLKLDGIITHRFSFPQINEALDAVRSGSAGRAILEMV